MLEARIQRLNETPLRYFYHESFDNPQMTNEITGAMPDLESFTKSCAKVSKIKKTKINPEMYPCYESALLSFAQEQHLFRKMNYYKYCAKKIIDSLCTKSPNEDSIAQAEKFVESYLEIRNQISTCNFRLATQIMRHRKAGKEKVDTDTILSDAYVDVIKAVDYFNWTFGHRFSTYATWVVKKNYFREHKNKTAQSEKSSSIDDSCVEFIDHKSSSLADEKKQDSRQKLIKKLIGIMVRENLGTDRVRQAYVLENYFGVNGRDKKTLEQISEDIGVTKERVRQLKEHGLEWIQQRVSDMSLEYDNDTPHETLF